MGKTLYDVLFSLLILSAPLIVFGVYSGGMSIRLSRLVMLLILPVLLCRFAINPALFMRDRFLLTCFAPYVAYTTLTATWSPDVATGTMFSRLGGLYEIFAIYLIMVGADLHASRYLRFIKLYFASSFVPLGFAIWQFANNVYGFSQTELPFQEYLIQGKYEELEGRYFVAGEGVSRLSSTFAEPVIFASYLVSVILLSLHIKPKSQLVRVLLNSYRALAFVVVIAALSKLAILLLVAGLLAITFGDRRFLKFDLFLAGTFLGLFLVLWNLDLLAFLERFVSETGHLAKLYESFEQLGEGDLIFGEGIGSIPYGSFHRFMLSRVYESGVMGFYFAAFLSALPILMGVTRSNLLASQVTNISRAVLIAVLIGLHAYDFFIHLWPWIVIGAISSFNNSSSDLRGVPLGGRALRAAS